MFGRSVRSAGIDSALMASMPLPSNPMWSGSPRLPFFSSPTKSVRVKMRLAAVPPTTAMVVRPFRMVFR